MNALLEIAISLVLIYLLMAILVSGFGELWSTLSHKRPRMLKNALKRVLIGDNYTQGQLTLIFDGLRRDAIALQPIKDSFTDRFVSTVTFGKVKSPDFPTWVDPNTFAQSVVGFILKFDPEEFSAYQEGQTGYVPATPTGSAYAGDRNLIYFIEQLDEVENAFRDTLETGHELPPIFNLLDSLVSVSDDIEELETKLSDWFNQYTSTMGEDYKKDMRWPLFISAALLTMVLNVDTIHLVRSLWEDDSLRESVVAQAEQINFDEFSKTFLDTANTDTAKFDKLASIYTEINAANEDLENLDLPIGWKSAEDYGLLDFEDTVQYVFEMRSSNPFMAFRDHAMEDVSDRLTLSVVNSEDSLLAIKFSLPAESETFPSVNNTLNSSPPSEEAAITFFKQQYEDSLQSAALKFLGDPNLTSDTMEIQEFSIDSLKLPFISGPAAAPPDPVDANGDSLIGRLIYASVFAPNLPAPTLIQSPEGYIFTRFLTRVEKDARKLKIEVAIETPENGQITVNNYREVSPYGMFAWLETFRRNLDTITGTQLIGWFITAFAASLGAPFWFELLKKLLSIRSGGSGNTNSSS